MATRPALLHLVDGTYELFRAHHSRGPRRTLDDGTDVSATYGVVRQVLSLLDGGDGPCTHLAVAFDNPIRSFRNDLYDGYKDGSGIEPALLDQFDLVERCVAALGVVVWSMVDHEADDALASAAVQLADQVGQVRILTPDKDLGQVVDDGRVVQVDRARDRVFDAAGVQARLGVPPSAVVDHLALVGDTADGIPGVPGIGAKTSAALLGAYGSIAAVPADPSSWSVAVRGAPRIGRALQEHADEVALWRTLATLVTDLALDPGQLDELAWRGPTDDLPAVADLLGSATIRGLAQR